jgi:hypothetical protein
MPSSTPVVSTSPPPTTDAPTTTVTTAATVSAAPGSSTVTACGTEPAVDLEASLRDQFVAYLASCGFTAEEAGCLFDNLDFGDPAVASGQSEPIVAAFDVCGIDQSRAAEIGG